MTNLRHCVSRMFYPSPVFPSGARLSDITCKSQKLMLETGLIRQSSPGTFHLLPFAVKALEKLSCLIDTEMENIGGQKVAMPSVGSASLWKKSSRWTTMGAELFKLQDRHNTEFCLSPTHEEAVTDIIAAETTLTPRNFPIRLYQVTTKFRDEPRPRYGLLRGREFLMKDMYTFDTSLDAARDTYQAVCGAYHRIFQKLGLQVIQAVGDSGLIGGDKSHEFILPADVGEDTIHHCPKCGLAANTETSPGESPTCPQNLCKPSCEVTQKKGIEVGHTFLLGQKYSEVFDASFTDQFKKKRNCEMGCYGLGVSRILAAAIEVLSSDQEVRWPRVIAPYQVCIIPPKEGSKESELLRLAEQIYDEIVATTPHLKGDVLLDDRLSQTIGRRLKDSQKIGHPTIVIVGKQALSDPAKFELHCTETNTTKFVTKSELFNYLKTIPIL
ncbi:putative proline--tRNA ligase, mitochondrial [Holothuria leucospilota]|uniref:Probable proline--tRNA ligase, mitochondrial n=1 Tax=Holothuria leucospilota TaxID=206669 RepID=A0A9Q1C8I5_HOLLE|nr:putative proline--tRNA ligase, mitochondrial [Holothuria leucospilota]